MRLMRVLLILTLSVVAAGCFNVRMTMRVKPDGSGTLEQTMLVNTKTLGQIAGMAGGGDAVGSLASKTDWKQQAAALGEVRLLTVDEIKDPSGFEGVKAVFAFDDVTKVKFAPETALQPAMGGSSSAQRPLTIAFVKGSPATLTITLQENLPAADTPADPATDPAQMNAQLENPMVLAMLKEMMKGARVALDVEVDGAITKTNADHVSGSKVTLLELDVDALLQADPDMKNLKAIPQAIKPTSSFADIKKALKDVKGVKLNDAVVTIEFK